MPTPLNLSNESRSFQSQTSSHSRSAVFYLVLGESHGVDFLRKVDFVSVEPKLNTEIILALARPIYISEQIHQFLLVHIKTLDDLRWWWSAIWLGRHWSHCRERFVKGSDQKGLNMRLYVMRINWEVLTPIWQLARTESGNNEVNLKERLWGG